MISVVILTKNEEKDLPECLDSLKWCDDIHVLDSGSTDATVEIARKAGAGILVNPFESFGKQRNFALDHISYKYPWILFLDADERVTPEFYEEMRAQVTRNDEEVAGYYCCWKMMLEGVWLKHCDNFPKWQFRLMKFGKARFTDYGHGQKEADIKGRIEYLKTPYLHYGFSKGWTHWIDRHNRYASLEAVERLKNVPPFSHVFSKHGSIRNPALKSRLSRMPGWPLLRFIHAYFINLGVLEGKPGFNYCVNMAYYEFLIKIKMREIRYVDKLKKRQ